VRRERNVEPTPAVPSSTASVVPQCLSLGGAVTPSEPLKNGATPHPQKRVKMKYKKKSLKFPQNLYSNKKFTSKLTNKKCQNIF